MRASPTAFLVAATFASGVLRGVAPVAIASGSLPVSALAATSVAIAMPGPAPHARADDRASANAACEACHEDVAAEWRGSLHQRAWSDPAFQASFAAEPYPFCQGCHAPEADTARAPPVAAADVGIGCVSCHVVGGDVLAAPLSPGGVAPSSPHAVVRDARFATESACAGCHEFDFPGGRSGEMQLTVTEHARSASADRPCASCHMPATTGSDGHARRSHDFAASTSEAGIRAAASVSAVRASATAVRVTIAPTLLGAGHAFPTGDLFRRLELRVSLDADDTRDPRAAERTVYLARRFGSEERNGALVIRVPHGDDRPFAGGSVPKIVDVDLGPRAQGRAIFWRLVYQRVAHLRGDDPRSAVIDSEIEVARGVAAP